MSLSNVGILEEKPQCHSGYVIISTYMSTGKKKYTKQLANDAWQKDALVFIENKNVEMSHVLRY